ncbi:response regulator [Azospirillum sp. ST 5-10]|uniref:response regulator n=1 Tax=unclassified Azospirillum TaxID=2630922 RepID=UPI003F4A5946
MSTSHHDLDILVVDDEEFSRSILVHMLRKLGIARIRQAADGQDGLTALRCIGRVDCIFLDFHMPVVNGLQMLKRIRDGSAGVDRAIPVAMLTGHSDMRLVTTAMALDVNAFLGKPTSLDLVASRLERVLTRDRDVKPAPAYAAVPLPTTIVLSTETALPPGGTRLVPSGRGERTGGVRTPLERIPANARLARHVDGPDGILLVPAGTVLSQRLLTHLYDLRPLYEGVAELWIEPAAP